MLPRLPTWLSEDAIYDGVRKYLRHILPETRRKRSNGLVNGSIRLQRVDELINEFDHVKCHEYLRNHL